MSVKQNVRRQNLQVVHYTTSVSCVRFFFKVIKPDYYALCKHENIGCILEVAWLCLSTRNTCW